MNTSHLGSLLKGGLLCVACLAGMPHSATAQLVYLNNERAHFQPMSYEQAKEAGWNVRPRLRADFGYTFHSTGLTQIQRAETRDADGLPNGDTVITRHLKAKGKIALETGNHIPLASLSERSMLALTYVLMLRMEQYDSVTMARDGQQMYRTTDLSLSQVSLPVGISYKYGGDAVLDKSYRLSAGISMGIMPTYTMVSDDERMGGKLKCSPFVSAEMGFFAGIHFKVRATHTFGKKYEVFHTAYSTTAWTGNNEALRTGTVNSFDMKPVTTISLLIMPFSYDWERSRWW